MRFEPIKSNCLTAIGSFLCTFVLVTETIAGPNNGVLTLIDPGIVYSESDGDDYCSFVPTPSCEEAVVTSDRTDLIILTVVAYLGGSPRLSGLTFGIEYPDDEIYFLAWGSCADFELPTSRWPESGEGTALTWGSPHTTESVEVYWLAGYNYYGNSNSIDLIPHPTQGANFADDDIPSNLDPILALGSFGFSGNPGNLPCVVVEDPGACCDECGECFLVLLEECDDIGGLFQGKGTSCDPNPCTQPVPGACCFFDGRCEFLNPCICESDGGHFQGGDILCDPDPCVANPTFETSWGSVKGKYR